jgi:hypothetical protein
VEGQASTDDQQDKFQCVAVFKAVENAELDNFKKKLGK